jgi:hypothetical protein
MTMALILAGAVLLASDPTPAVDGRSEAATVVKVADYTAPAVKRKRRVHAYHNCCNVRDYPPVACEAVRFPRSPLCADRPYRLTYRYEWWSW